MEVEVVVVEVAVVEGMAVVGTAVETLAMAVAVVVVAAAGNAPLRPLRSLVGLSCPTIVLLSCRNSLTLVALPIPGSIHV